MRPELLNGRSKGSALALLTTTEIIASITGDIMRRERLDSAPSKWFAPPDGNRSRLFLGNEKPSFLGISMRAAGHRSSVAGGVEGNALISSVERDALCWRVW